MANNFDNEEVGAIWNKVSASGNKYMSGYVEVNGKRQDVVVFSNANKANPNAPDYRVYISGRSAKKTSTPNKPVAKTYTKPVPKPQTADNEGVDV